MSIARILIATPETDAQLRAEYNEKGRQAHQSGLSESSAPSGGLIRNWWLEGYRNAGVVGQVAGRTDDQTVQGR